MFFSSGSTKQIQNPKRKKKRKMPPSSSSSSPSSLTCRKLTLMTISAMIIQMVGLALFVLGFFPVKPTLHGVSGVESYYPPGNDSVEHHNVTDLSPDQLKSLYQQLSGVSPSYDRLILMVIDGLPAEFVLGKDGQPPPKVFSEAMPYTQSLLSKGRAIGYHAKAAPPTVTMPRLKAMVSGAIGGFLDVAFNFNTQALLDDNLIGQFIRIGWKIVMLGDETWLKLFPGMFMRHDGVSSFFVKDTVQVDYNVSRHLGDELNRTDWNLLILHYLGLDHVGHIGGRKSALMSPKLREMDEVIQMIDLNTIQNQEEDRGRTLLLVVSDHGMTENGNHGGSSYEEIDSLALFIGPEKSSYVSASRNTANQVDIAPTLALLFGVPIPKNNVGFLMVEAFKSLTDDQQLRLLELNSWQLMRLIQAQLPHLACGSFSCDAFQDGSGSVIGARHSTLEKMFCCSYLDAATFHKSFMSMKFSSSTGEDDSSSTFLAYHGFLESASQWLSRRATDKPVGLLVSGLAAMLLSCFLLMKLLFMLGHEVYFKKNHYFSHIETNTHRWQLDEIFIATIVFVLILCMGSSSMVEEEQYIWNFMSSSLYFILLRKIIQSTTVGDEHVALNSTMARKRRCSLSILSVLVILICGRLLRGWHQGGINWVHLPDISKWLEQEGNAYIKLLRLVSGALIIGVGLFSLLLPLWSKRNFVMLMALIYLFPGLMVMQHIIKYQESITLASSYAATTLAQRIYAFFSICAVGTLIAVPWLMPFQNPKTSDTNVHSSQYSSHHKRHFLLQFRDCVYVIGWAYIYCWCLLQLLLQQPINSVPILLLFLQILASLWYFSWSDLDHKQWVEVAALYCLGMAGHFGLGNTNSVATIDVAGAFIGVSSYSTLLSGILMFIITYASPMLALLSTVMYISIKYTDSLMNAQDVDFSQFLMKIAGFPCLVPLVLNSILLIAYTIVLLLMRNHLFIWSVFSPKYLYVCATTVCVCIGVSIVALSVLYTFMGLILRGSWQASSRLQLKGSR